MLREGDTALDRFCLVRIDWIDVAGIEGVDTHPCGWEFNLGRAMDESLWMSMIGDVEGLLANLRELRYTAEEDICWCKQGEPTMSMVIGIPGEKIGTPGTCMANIVKPSRRVRLAFDGFERRFRKRIIVRHPWPIHSPQGLSSARSSVHPIAVIKALRSLCRVTSPGWMR